MELPEGFTALIRSRGPIVCRLPSATLPRAPTEETVVTSKIKNTKNLSFADEFFYVNRGARSQMLSSYHIYVNLNFVSPHSKLESHKQPFERFPKSKFALQEAKHDSVTRRQQGSDQRPSHTRISTRTKIKRLTAKTRRTATKIDADTSR